jgi:tetratricopeptide (TPR) repeat protein
MYNLGIAYKKQQNYQLAAVWLAKAYSAKNDWLTNELKQQILLELGRTNKKLGKARESEEAFRTAKTVAVNRSGRASAAFELGRCLFEQGRYDEALVELRAGQTISSDKDDNFANFIQVVEYAAETRRLHLGAEEALALRNLPQAQAFVEQLRSRSDASASVEALAARVDSLAKAETARRVWAVLYEQAQKETTAGNWESAAITYESLLQQAGDYKDAAARLEEVRQRIANKQAQAQLEEDYAAGLSAWREQNWTQAILAFEKVLAVDANFGEAGKMLAEAKRGLEKESLETVTARYYVDGVTAMNRDDLGAALAAFEKVRKLNPRYRDAGEMLAEVEQRLQQKATPTAAVSPQQLEALYQEALVAREAQDWLQAVVALEKLQLLQPNYRDVITLLAEARANLLAAEKGVVPDAGNSLGYAVGVIVAVIFPLFGFAIFSPAARARLYLLRGNLPAAAQLYETILSRHPGRVKLYPILANLYLLMGRHDEKAMKIFKTTLDLNLATQRREEINTIVAQRYLTEGRTDSDAIAVLESALQAERRKQNYSNPTSGA